MMLAFGTRSESATNPVITSDVHERACPRGRRRRVTESPSHFPYTAADAHAPPLCYARTSVTSSDRANIRTYVVRAGRNGGHFLPHGGMRVAVANEAIHSLSRCYPHATLPAMTASGAWDEGA